MPDNQDNSIKDLPDNTPEVSTDLDPETSVAVAEPGEEPLFSPGTPPDGHRIRVNSADLEQGKKETDNAFNQRKREYETEPDPFSPTGRKKNKIYLQDFDVKCIGKNKLEPARIEGVPAAPDAIREFMLLRGIKHAAGYRFRAFPVADTKRDAGDAGYASNHVPEAVRRRRLSPEDREKLEELD